MTKDIFKKEWNEKESQYTKKTIVKYLSSRFFFSHKSPDKTPFIGCKYFSDYATALGLAYTSSSEYAGLWACSDELYLDINKVYRLQGFALGNGGFVYSIWSDINGNELMFPIN